MNIDILKSFFEKIAGVSPEFLEKAIAGRLELIRQYKHAPRKNNYQVPKVVTKTHEQLNRISLLANDLDFMNIPEKTKFLTRKVKNERAHAYAASRLGIMEMGGIMHGGSFNPAHYPAGLKADLKAAKKEVSKYKKRSDEYNKIKPLTDTSTYREVM